MLPPQEGALLRALLERCRDRDGEVRQHAFQLLVEGQRQLQQQQQLWQQDCLQRHLSHQGWRALLDAGLAGAGAGAGPAPGRGGTSGGKQQAATRSAACELLRRYLAAAAVTPAVSVQMSAGMPSQEGSAGNEAVADAETEGAAGGGSDGGYADEAWLGRLLLVLPLAQVTAGTIAQHLHAAWLAALRQVLRPEQRARLAQLPGWQRAEESE